MNRGHVMQKSPVVQQQMMGGSPNWWNMINNMRPPIISHHPHHQQQQAATHHHLNPSNFLPPTNNQLIDVPHQFSTIPTLPPSSSSPSSSLQDLSSTTNSWSDHNQDQLPESWSQLLLGGLVGEEEKSRVLSNMHQQVKNNWEEELFLSQQQAAASSNNNDSVDVKQKNLLLPNSYHHDMYEQHAAGGGGGGNNNNGDYFHQHTELTAKPSSWSVQQMMPVSSPKSCVTTLSSNNNNMLDFSNKKSDARHPPPDHSSECNSRAATGGAPNKRARVQPSSTQSTFKVRKEKLGDRITALHQLVSPFGKTDTASVLLEAIGYIRFLQSQIEALSLPYLGSGSANMRHQHPQQSVHQERNSLFPEDPGQLSNDNCLKRKITNEEDYHEETKKDLRSRGLCLVPVSCTLQVGSDNGADYWAPAALGGGYR